MQTPHCISPFFIDYQAISSSVLLPTLAPGLQNSHDTAPIAISPLADSDLPLPGAAEHNPPAAGENVRNGTEFIIAREI
jgi:hypothetical protein